MMFGLLSLRPEYSQIVRPFIALAPMVTMGDVIKSSISSGLSKSTSTLSFSIPVQSLISSWLSQYTTRQLIKILLISHRQEFPMKRLLSAFCTYVVPDNNGDDDDDNTRHSLNIALCQRLGLLSPQPDRLNVTRIRVYEQFMPKSVSTWTIAHWIQLLLLKNNNNSIHNDDGHNSRSNSIHDDSFNGKFIRFDYGSSKQNIRHYGQKQAPEFPLDSIPADTLIIMFCGQNDIISTQGDTDRLVKRLKHRNGLHNIVKHMINDPGWTHTDFILGQNVGRLVYDRVVEELDNWY